MRVTTVLALVASAAAGFAAAKRLLSPEELPQQIPAPARRQANRARRSLVEVREEAAFAIREARSERERAKHDLMNDYLRRAGRPPRP